jgi:hypothetical protein
MKGDADLTGERASQFPERTTRIGRSQEHPGKNGVNSAILEKTQQDEHRRQPEIDHPVVKNEGT